VDQLVSVSPGNGNLRRSQSVPKSLNSPDRSLVRSRQGWRPSRFQRAVAGGSFGGRSGLIQVPTGAGKTMPP